jgi:hypothetical protein
VNDGREGTKGATIKALLSCLAFSDRGFLVRAHARIVARHLRLSRGAVKLLVSFGREFSDKKDEHE